MGESQVFNLRVEKSSSNNQHTYLLEQLNRFFEKSSLEKDESSDAFAFISKGLHDIKRLEEYSDQDYLIEVATLRDLLLTDNQLSAENTSTLLAIQVAKLNRTSSEIPIELYKKTDFILNLSKYNEAPAQAQYLEALAYQQFAKWIYLHLNQPNIALEYMSRSISKLNALDQPFEYQKDFETYFTFCLILLESKQLLQAEYLLRAIIYELQNADQIKQQHFLLSRTFIQMAHLYNLQSNPDSVVYYAEKAMELSPNSLLKLEAEIEYQNAVNGGSASFFYRLKDQKNYLITNSLHLTEQQLYVKLLYNELISKIEYTEFEINANDYELIEKLCRDLSQSPRPLDFGWISDFAYLLAKYSDSNGNWNSIDKVEALIEMVLPKFGQIAETENWSFSAFKSLSTLNKALLILVKQGRIKNNLNTVLQINEQAIQSYFRLRSNQLLLENLLYVGHNISDIFRVNSELYFELSRKNPNLKEANELLEKSFVFADMNRAQMQLDLLLVNNNFIKNKIGLTDRRKYYSLYVQSEQVISSIYKQPSIDALNTLDLLTIQMQNWRYTLKNGSNDWEDIWKEPQEYLNDILMHLEVDQSLILYNLFDDAGRVFVLSKQGIQVRSIRYAPGLSEKIDELKTALMAQKDQDLIDRLNMYLSSILIQPIEDLLSSRIFLITDAETESLPYNMLLKSNGSMLIDDHILSKTPSARILINKRLDDQPTEPRVSIVAPHEFENPGLPGSFSSLPFTLVEAEQLASIVVSDKNWLPWVPKNEVLILKEEEANASNILTEDVFNSSIIHFATHSYTDFSNPNNTRVILNRAAGFQNAALRLRDIYNLPFKSNLVVLNGCETGTGKVVNGEGTIGLTHAFLVSGAKHLVSSLWPVEDQSAARFMDEFYSNLFEEVNPWQADFALVLNKTIRQIKKYPEFRDPYIWATFYTIGW